MDLASTQRWFQAIVRHPDGPAAGIASAEARREVDLPVEELDRVVRPTASLTSAEHVALYHRGYYLRLLECLRSLHPALRHALGEGLFDEFAREYLEENPSHSYTLAHLNRGFAEHLQANRPDAGGPDEVWPDFLVDLAAIERAFLEIYEGPGAEGDALVTSSQLPTTPSHAWLDAVFVPVPSLRLFRSRFPVGRYLAAVRDGRDPQLPLPREESVALHRRDFAVVITELDSAAFVLLSEVLGGSSIREAAHTAGVAVSDAWDHVRDWADRSFFRSATVCEDDREGRTQW